jgi:mono/diheme cytochrome c family protein
LSPADEVVPEPVPGPPDDERGGRLYDNWRAEKALEKSFVPDSAKTAELDGKGGPFGNGTLGDGSGKPMPNTGHDYRLKNFFGWDLRGTAGVYGPDYQKKATALGRDLLSETQSSEALRASLALGGEGLPAFSDVLNARDLDDLVAFIQKTRARELAHPADIFALDKSAPKGFKLLPGGDATRGKQRFAASCSKCHGEDGRDMAIDDVESVGSISRSSGYEIWFKILNGQPGTDMDRQIEEKGGAEQARAILDLLAALCDRTAFPPLKSGKEAKDVPSADPRCGAYLR